jgi:hypothetical protein
LDFKNENSVTINLVEVQGVYLRQLKLAGGTDEIRVGQFLVKGTESLLQLLYLFL